jgi:holo-[acyl-carrier protein] synthase
MKVQIGIDVVGADEVNEALSAYGQRYLKRVYTNRELRESGGDALKLAARFAAKEATIKALRPRDEAVPWRSIELRDGGDSEPELGLAGAAAELAARAGIAELSVSLGERPAAATAVVVATEGPGP